MATEGQGENGPRVAPQPRCAACGASGLEPHFAVSGDRGEEGLIPSTARFGVALGDFVRCRRCGHLQLDPLPAGSELAHAYGEAESLDYVVEERGQRATARATLARIERHVRPGALLELGCWVGYLLAEARERGWEPYGVEPSAFASRFARERLGLDVVHGDLDSADLGDRRYDAVFLRDVIEHLPDPAGAVGRIGELLAPGGVVAIATPDAGSRVARLMGRRWWSVIPTHVHLFTRRSLTTLLARQGFAPLELRTAPKAFSVGYYLGRLGGYNDALGRGLVAASGRVGVGERLWSPDFGDRMLLIARPR